jgi:hypothetical protein
MSGGKTHKYQLMTGRMHNFGLFVCTFESATYTKLLLTTGSLNHGEIESEIYFGTGEAVCVTAARKRWGDVSVD